MANVGAMAEFARLSPSRKALVFALFGGVIALAYWKIAYKALDEELDAAQADHDAKLRTSNRLTADLKKYDELRTRMAEQQQRLDKVLPALSSDAEIPAFFETLQRRVSESGVEVHRWANRNQEPVEGFVKTPVDVELAGTFMQIKRFFASLAQRDVKLSPTSDEGSDGQRERLVSIENLALSSPTVRNREIILTARFVAVMFRQETKPATPDQPANDQPDAAAGKSPAPKPAAASPSEPPLPGPTNTKGRLEKALDAADARNRNAGGVDEAKLPAAGSDRLKGGL
jgi:Tfp pilus assembly protein PilO